MEYSNKGEWYLHNSTVHNHFSFHQARSDNIGTTRRSNSQKRNTDINVSPDSGGSGQLIFHEPDRCERPPDVRGH